MATIPILLAMAIGLVIGAAFAYYFLRGQQQVREMSAVERERGANAAAVAKLQAELEAERSRMAEARQSLDQLREELRAAIALLEAEKIANTTAQAEVKGMRSMLDLRDRELDAAQKRQSQQEELLAGQQSQLAQTKTELETLRIASQKDRESLTARLEQLGQVEENLKDTMAALAREALEGNNRSFLELAKEQLGSIQKEHKAELDQRKQAVETLVQPIRERLEGVQKAVQEFDRSSAERHAGLGEHMRQLGEAQRTLHGEAQNLTTALRGKPGLRGTWGEMQLRRAVELAGMQKYVDFDEQKQVLEGRERPDMTVKLPNGHSIAVDSKAVTESYMPVVQAEAEAEREAAMKAFAMKVRNRVKELADRNYWAKIEQSPDFVVMFLPGESIFSTALEADPALLEFGVQNNVILATPLTLIALLRAVAYGWRQEQLAENAEKISRLGQDLYDRVRRFSEHLQGVGKGLNSATDAYNQAVGSLESRVLPQARKFKELGAGGKDEIQGFAALDIRPRELAAPELLSHQDDGAADGAGGAI